MGAVVSAAAGATTLTTKVAGARLNVPLVLFEVWLTLIVVDPTPCGVTVMVGVSPQLENVIELGETVATPGFVDATETTSVVLPVWLQPFLPSPFVGST